MPATISQQKLEALNQELNHPTLVRESATTELSNLKYEYDFQIGEIFSIEALMKECKEKLDEKHARLCETEENINYQQKLVQALENQQAELVVANQVKVESINQELNRTKLAIQSNASELSKLNLENDAKSERIRILEFQLKEHKEKLAEKTVMVQDGEAKINSQNEQILSMEADRAQLVVSSQRKVESMNHLLNRSNLETESAVCRISKLNLINQHNLEKMESQEFLIRELKETLEENSMLLQAREAQIDHQTKEILKLKDEHSQLLRAIQQMREFQRPDVYQF